VKFVPAGIPRIRPLCSEHGQELLEMVVVPSETIVAIVLIPKSTQALDGGDNRALAPVVDGFCQTIWKETPPVLEAGVPGLPVCCEEPPEQAERVLINKILHTMKLSE
jgi:hypothetical protein